jgi:hypothetical protein
MKTSPHYRDSRKGGVLITAMIMAFCLVIVLTGYLSMTRALIKSSNRNLYLAASLDLAETGMEQAMWALNAAANGNVEAWSGWTIDGGNAWRKFPDFAYSGGNAGSVNVHVANFQNPGAVITSKAVVTLADGQVVEKWIKGTLKGRSLFEYGLLARDKISAEGGCIFDSWISDPDMDPNTPAVAYSSSIARSNGSIAAGAVGASSVTLKPSAKVYGKVSVGTASGPTITYGSLGTWPITPGTNAAAGLKQDWGTVVGEKGSPDTYLQQDYLVTDFSADFEQVEAPAGATVRASFSLPYSYDDPSTAWNDSIYVSGNSWDDPRAPKPDIGSDGATTVLQMDKLTVKASSKLTIRGDVTIILPSTGVTTVEVIEGGALTLATGASLKIYTPGNIKVTGGGSAGIVNNSAPEALQIWSTRPLGSMGQTISLEGSGSLRAVIYAPDATFSAPGGTHFYGSAVVYSAALVGSGSVHYDESLKNFAAGGGSAVAIASYEELTTPQARAAYAAALEF